MTDYYDDDRDDELEALRDENRELKEQLQGRRPGPASKGSPGSSEAAPGDAHEHDLQRRIAAATSEAEVLKILDAHNASLAPKRQPVDEAALLNELETAESFDQAVAVITRHGALAE